MNHFPCCQSAKTNLHPSQANNPILPRLRIADKCFKCKQCGYTIHADLNGAINIATAISGLVA
jgi:transposase